MSFDAFLQSNASDLVYPNIRPSLDLNFAKTKTLDPRITFTRNSTGTYVGSDGLIKTAVANEPRFDYDPVTGQCLGLLIEESRTNLLTYSEQFDNTGWIKNTGQITFSANAEVAPDGTYTADLVNNIPNLSSWCRPAVSISNSTTYTFSLYVKPLTTNKILVFEHTGSTNQTSFNLDTLTTSGPGTRQIIPISNGWYRIVWTFTGISGLSGFPQFPTLFIGGYPTTSDSASFLFWGTQVEAGTFPTSYIPTLGSTVTRAVDIANITGTNFSSWYNQSEGTMLVDISKSAFVSGAQMPIVGLDGNNNIGDNINEIRFEFNDPSNLAGILGFTSSSVNIWGFNVRFGGPAPNSQKQTLTRLGYALDVNSISASSNYGDFLKENYSYNVLPGVSRLTLNRGSVGTPSAAGSVVYKRITYYPKRLPDSQLQLLTK